MKRVLVTEPIHPEGIALMEVRNDIEIVHAENAEPATIAKLMPGINAIVVRTAQLNASLLRLSKKLQIVSRHGVGCDNLDIKFLTEQSIPIAIAAGANSTSVAELTFAMILNLTRRLRELDSAVRNNDFGARSRLLSFELEGSNILVLGFGRIGQKVAARARAFGMNVTVADVELNRDLAEKLGCRAVNDFRIDLKNTDILSLHIPLSETTRNIISDEELTKIKSGAIIINCARGGVLDEGALLRALESGQLSGAGLDVFSTEPPPIDGPAFAQLMDRKDIIFAPHCGAASTGAMEAMAKMAVQNILDFFDGKLESECIFNYMELKN